MIKRRPGFTLTELIIVIAIIGILATIALIGFGRFQADARDARRLTAVTTISEALEKYYDQGGEYPACLPVEANATVVTANTLKGIDESVLVAPQAPTGQSNSIECIGNPVLTMSSDDFYEYTGDGSVACSGSIACLQYTLRYKEESSNSVKEIKSRRNTAIATSGASTISSSGLGFTDVTLNWTDVQNASSYLLQRSSSAGDWTAATEYTTSGALSRNVSGLSSGATYYFRVRPLTAGDEGLWSNTLPVTMLSLATPSASAIANSNSQITVSWGAIANATSYTIDYATSAAGVVSSPTTITGVTGTSRAVTGLATGQAYYFRVRAVNGPNTGGWSNIVSATTFVPVPTGLAANTFSSTQINTTWNTVSVATSYTLQYDEDSGFGSPVTLTGIATNSRNVTGLAQGERFYFRVYALVGATSSNASSVVNAVTTINAPSGASIGVDRPCCSTKHSGDWDWLPGQSFDEGVGYYYYAYGAVNGTCPAGTTREVYMNATYNSPVAYYTANWSTAGTWYMISPWDGYSVIFSALVRCAGPEPGIYSAQVSAGSGSVSW